MSRRTEDDSAADLLADLKSRGFRICEFVPEESASYLSGEGGKEWRPIDDKRATRLFAAALLDDAAKEKA